MIPDEGIPCNLAPAHFTVHVVQVRLNFALGFVVEANPLFETGFSPGCPFFSFDFSFLSASTMRKREAGNPSRSASVLASSALLSICCVHKRRSASAAASAPGRMDFLSPRNTIVEIFDFTRFFFCFHKIRGSSQTRSPLEKGAAIGRDRLPRRGKTPRNGKRISGRYTIRDTGKPLAQWACQPLR